MRFSENGPIFILSPDSRNKNWTFLRLQFITSLRFLLHLFRLPNLNSNPAKKFNMHFRFLPLTQLSAIECTRPPPPPLLLLTITTVTTTVQSANLSHGGSRFSSRSANVIFFSSSFFLNFHGFKFCPSPEDFIYPRLPRQNKKGHC